MESSAPTNHPSGRKAWIEATRPRTLPVSTAGVLAGCAVALFQGNFIWQVALICFLFAMTAQIVSNFANEYFDFKSGFDKKGREGFRRGVTEGDISPRAMKTATFALLGLDCLLGCSLMIWGGWQLIPIGVAIAIFAIAYSAGPYPLSHHGLGDLAVVIFFGIVPVYFTATLQAPGSATAAMALPAGLATGLLAANVLIVNNYRDADDDRAVGKHTTVVIFGRKAMGIAYLISAVAALCILCFITCLRVSPLYAAGWYIILQLYILVWRKMLRSKGAQLNAILKRTAQLMLLACLYLLIISIMA